MKKEKEYKLKYFNFNPKMYFVYLLIIGYLSILGWDVAYNDIMHGIRTVILKKYVV
jgi:hypothetical protein